LILKMQLYEAANFLIKKHSNCKISDAE